MDRVFGHSIENTNKRNQGNSPISSRTQRDIIMHFKELNDIKDENGKKIKKSSVIQYLMKHYNVKSTKMYQILRNGPISPKKTKNRPHKYAISPEDIPKIDEIIENIPYPSIRDVFKKIEPKDSLSFKKCSESTFYRMMKKAGYKSRQTQKISREMKIAEKYVKDQSIYYLIKKRQLEKLGYPFIYFDETYVHKNFVRAKVLMPLKNRNGKSKSYRLHLKIAKGSRFSVLHAGGEDGFIEGALFVKKNIEMNAEKFENWLKDQLLPNLKQPSVIVHDNAQIHSRILNPKPTTRWRKEPIKKWLIENNIKFSNKDSRTKLLNLVKTVTDNKYYVVDKMIKEAGHIPLRTPPYCCELNPIELIWARWKYLISVRNITNSDDQFQKLIEEIFNEINDEYWRSCMRSLVITETKFWENDEIDKHFDKNSSKN